MAQPPPLPSGWTAAIDKRCGRWYFINHLTKETTYNDPRLQIPVAASNSTATVTAARPVKKSAAALPATAHHDPHFLHTDTTFTSTATSANIHEMIELDELSNYNVGSNTTSNVSDMKSHAAFPRKATTTTTTTFEYLPLTDMSGKGSEVKESPSLRDKSKVKPSPKTMRTLYKAIEREFGENVIDKWIINDIVFECGSSSESCIEYIKRMGLGGTASNSRSVEKSAATGSSSTVTRLAEPVASNVDIVESEQDVINYVNETFGSGTVDPSIVRNVIKNVGLSSILCAEHIKTMGYDSVDDRKRKSRNAKAKKGKSKKEDTPYKPGSISSLNLRSTLKSFPQFSSEDVQFCIDVFGSDAVEICDILEILEEPNGYAKVREKYPRITQDQTDYMTTSFSGKEAELCQMLYKINMPPTPASMSKYDKPKPTNSCDDSSNNPAVFVPFSVSSPIIITPSESTTSLIEITPPERKSSRMCRKDQLVTNTTRKSPNRKKVRRFLHISIAHGVDPSLYQGPSVPVKHTCIAKGPDPSLSRGPGGRISCK